MDIKVALKNALGTIQTPTTAANYGATDLVPLFDSNDQLIGKISRNELMSAVKTSLGTLLNQGAADLGTSLAKIPALNSGGTLGSATVANLASVLGVTFMPEARPSDMNDFIGDGVEGQILAFCAPNTAPANMPSGFLNPTRFYALVYNSNRAYDLYQRIIPRGLAGNSFERYRTGTTWSDWKEISTDIPSFYKNYNDLASLALGLGVTPIEKIQNTTELDGISFEGTQRVKFGYYNASAAHSGSMATEYSGFIVTAKISMMDSSTPHSESDSMQIIFGADTDGVPNKIKIRTKIDNVWGTFKSLTLA